MATISARVKETIPTAKYANVELDFTITKEVDDKNAADLTGKLYDELDEVFQIKRDEIISSVEKGNS